MITLSKNSSHNSTTSKLLLKFSGMFRLKRTSKSKNCHLPPHSWGVCMEIDAELTFSFNRGSGNTYSSLPHHLPSFQWGLKIDILGNQNLAVVAIIWKNRKRPIGARNFLYPRLRKMKQCSNSWQIATISDSNWKFIDSFGILQSVLWDGLWILLREIGKLDGNQGIAINLFYPQSNGK